MLVGGIGLAIALAGIIIAIAKEADFYVQLTAYGAMIILGVLLIVGSCLKASESSEERWNAAIDQGYEFYVEGRKVSPENLDREAYNVEYADEYHKVLLCKN